MAFQDFDQIHERVNAERKRKFRKKIIIASVSTLVIIAAILGCIFAYVTYSNQTQEEEGNKTTNTNTKAKSSDKNDQKSPLSAAQSVKPGNVDKIIKALCKSSLYKSSCEKTLGTKTKKDTPLSDPRSLLKSSIKAVNEDLTKAIEKVLKLKTENKDEKDGLAQCKLLVEDANEELVTSQKRITDTEVNNYAEIAPELDNWLSAVMSYQESCLDGFEEGKLKTELRKNLNSSQASTSNSLSVIKSLDVYLSSLPKVKKRQLLESRSSSSYSHVPSWLSKKERRMLKGVDVKDLKPNVTVAKDGSGKFKTISDALKAMPDKYKGRYVIYIKQGVYEESVVVDKKKVNVTMIGDGSQKTIVTGNKSNTKKGLTLLTATFVAQGEGFMAQSIGFRNTAGPDKLQAVATRVQSDRSVFLNCRFEGYQNTLHAYTHRQYYRSCVIIGTIDFIFGDAAAIFQNCDIFIRKGVKDQKNTVTSQGRVDKFQTTGFVLHKCTIAPNDDLKPAKAEFKSYLGRPWKNCSRTVVMESTIEDVIDPVGWLRLEETDFAIKTLFFGEFKNVGPRGGTGSRVKWPGFRVLKTEEAVKFTVEPFLHGEWIQEMKSPVKFGLYAP